MLPTITNGQLFVEHYFPELFCAFKVFAPRASPRRTTWLRFEKSLSVQHFYCGTFNFFSTAIRAKILKRSQPKISDEDDPLSVGPVVYIIKVLRTFKGTFDEKEIVELKTPTNGIENFCKVKLNVKETYLLTGKKGEGQLEIWQCDWHELWKDETRKKIREAQKKCWLLLF